MEKKELKRTLTLFPAVMILVTSVIGGGIFTVQPDVMKVAQGSGPNILAWVIAGALCMMMGLVYLELGPAMPKAGGPYIYLREAYGGVASFLYGGMSIINFSAVLAVISFSFANYLNSFFGYGDLGVKLVATALLMVTCITNLCGIRFSTKVINWLTVGKLAVLGAVILVGIFFIKGVNFQPVAAPGVGWSSTVPAVVPALFAFSGYVQVVYMAEDIKDPGKTIPKALMIGIGIIVFFYIALSVVCTGVLSVQGLTDSTRAIADAAKAILGPVGGTIITIGALISIYATVNSGFLSFPRVVFSMGRDGEFPSIFAKTNEKFGTPHVAILTFLVVSLILLWAGQYFFLLMMCTFIARLMEILVAGSLLILRKKRPDLERPIKMPGFPVTWVLVILLDIYLATLVPWDTIKWGLLFAAICVALYFVFQLIKKFSGPKPEAQPKDS